LDGETGAQVIELLFDLQAAHGTTLVLITHDSEVAVRCRRGLRMKDGRIEEPGVASAAAVGE
jgi:putative ABC transport system ATP-binding protein